MKKVNCNIAESSGFLVEGMCLEDNYDTIYQQGNMKWGVWFGKKIYIITPLQN